tara:strand:+ start:204 stop:1310 length:1107 start_codon:yes stop_codon:yes gene_type:complete
MEIKVREVTDVEEKSTQQVEQELLNKHEEQFVDSKVESTETPKVEVESKAEAPVIETATENNELKEEEVLKYIGERYGRDIKSFDDLNQQRENEPLPEDVSQYLKYKKETGRGFSDFAKLQKNYDEMEPDNLLREYLVATEKGLDAEDIEDLMEDYDYDEDLDDDKSIKKIKLAKKKTIAKAKDYFEQQQEQYRVPLESSRESSSEYSEEEIEGYRQYIANAKTSQEGYERKSEIFQKKTDDVFSEFKGFEFTLDDNKVLFSPGDAAELKKSQLNPQNFIDKFLDDDGIMVDAAGYHKSLAMAMHPEKFAKFFYEQGKSASADDTMRELKNIKMDTKRAPEVTKTNNGMQVTALNDDSGRGLKIRKRK